MPVPLESLLVGRTLLDRYRIEEAIGRGGMSIVYRAHDTRLGRRVAVKVLSLSPSGSVDRETLRERLRREAASAAHIPPHPNVVQVYDYGTDPELDLDFIVMELLRGRDLREELHGRRLDPREGLRIVREAARGVSAGHRAGIVHRDVKPGNILLVGEQAIEVVKILDFGIAKALQVSPGEELTRTGQMPHSPAYASPEQLRGEHSLTPASDVYQLGLVAYEILTGSRPFDEDDRARLRDGEPRPLPRTAAWNAVPEGVRGVVERALHPDPRERYADASGFLEALVAAEESDDATALLLADAAPPAEPAATASPPPPLRPAGSPAGRPPAGRRSALPMKVAAAGVMGILAVWGLSQLGGGEDDPPGAGETPAAAETSGETPGAAEPGVIDAAALEEEFRPILLDAYERIQEEAGPLQGEEAAAAVQEAIIDLNESWVEGEMERHLAHYADRVDFYAADAAPRSRIERERQADLDRYPRREISIDQIAVTFPAPGRARALVDKSWVFDGGDDRREGSARQELVLELQDERWRVVSERILESFQ